MATKQQKPPVVPKLDLSQLNQWNDKYFQVQPKKGRKKTVSDSGLDDTGTGLDITDEMSEGIAAILDEDSGPYKYQFRREEIRLSYDPAVKLNPTLEKILASADELAENEEYDSGIKVLDEKLSPECERALKEAKMKWAVKEKEFFEYRKMGERFAEIRAKKLGDLDSRINDAKSSKQAESQQKLEQELTKLKQTPDRGAKLNALYKEASEAAEALDYATAFEKIDEATKEGLQVDKQLMQLADSVAKETDEAAAEEKKTFDFASKTKDKKWGFDSDDDARNFFIGMATDEGGGLVASDKLLKIGAQVKAALARLGKLTSAGMSPEKAADIAFKNIPKNFWPDRVVREVIMYKRARATFEAEKQAELQAHETEDLLQRVESLSNALESGSDKIDTLSDQLDPETIEKRKKQAKELGNLGLKSFSKDAVSALNSDQLKKVGEALGSFADDFGYATTGFGVLVKGAQAVKSTIDSHKTGDESPVEKKLMEFKRNKAIFQAVDALINAGLALSDICPALKIASGGKEMGQEALKATMYFVKLAEIADLKSDAKLDPETMMALPLARMARNQGLRASKSTVAVITAAIQTAGAIGEMTGIGSAAGLGLHVSGKVLELGGKAIFKGIDWADARRCVRTMKKAAGPPPIRKAMTMIFKNSTRYATYALAFGAVEGNDPWAIQYVVNQKLTEEDLKSPATSIEIVREYMLLTAGGIMGEEDEEEDDPTILPGQKKKPKGLGKVKEAAKKLAVNGAKKARDKIIGRDTSNAYDAKWRATKIELTRDAWQPTKQDAIKAGWYDTRSGLSESLGEYQQAAQAFASAEAIATVIELGAALDELGHAISEVGTMANDQKTPHDGMLDFVEQMFTKVEQERSRIRPIQQKLYDQQTFGDLTGDELAEAKQQKIDSDLEEAREKHAEKATARLNKIKKFWTDRKHPTPYGNVTLSDFCTKASDKLGLDSEESLALIGSTMSINEDCCIELRDLLSAVPEDRIDRELDRQAAQLEKSLVEDLRDLAQSHLDAMKMRTAPSEEDQDIDEGDTADDGSKWKAPNYTLSKKAWTGVKKDAVKHGLLDKASGITKALDVLEKQRKAFQDNRDDQKNVQLVVGALESLYQTFEKFKPLNRQKLVHRGMADYRSKMMTKVREYQLTFKKEQSNKKIVTTKQKQEDLEQRAAAIKNDYKATPFAKSAWKVLLAKGIEDGLDKKATGLPKAFDIYDKARLGFENEKDVAKRTKARELYLKAIANLNNTLTKFEPKLKNKAPHDGLVYWRSQMITALDKIRTTVPV